MFLDSLNEYFPRLPIGQECQLQWFMGCQLSEIGSNYLPENVPGNLVFTIFLCEFH